MLAALTLEPRMLPAALWLADHAEREGRRDVAAFWVRHALSAGGADAAQRAALSARAASLGPAVPAVPGFPATDLRTARARAEGRR